MKMKRIQLLLLIPLFLISCSANRSSRTNVPNQSSELMLLLDSLDQELSTFKERTLIPGIALSIVSGQDIVFQKGYGYANLQQKEPFTVRTIQPIASISKTIVGVALMKLVDMGKINLDDQVNSFIPFHLKTCWKDDFRGMIQATFRIKRALFSFL